MNHKQGSEVVFYRLKGISRWIAACMLLSFCIPQSVCLTCFFSTLTTARCHDASCDCEHSSECGDECASVKIRHEPLSGESSCPNCAAKMLIVASAHLSDPPLSTILCSWIPIQFTQSDSWHSTPPPTIPCRPASGLQPFHTRI